MSAPTAESTADLVRRIVAGEAQAEADLVERFGRPLRFLSVRYTRDEATAEDLFQETIVLALQKIRNNEVRQPERLGAFLRALAKNLSVQLYRRRSQTAETPAENLDDAPDDRAPSALAGLLIRERAQRTRRLLGELATPRDRAVLFRYYLGEESSDRICRDLDIEGDHFYRVLHRARQRYRKLWEVDSPPQ